MKNTKVNLKDFQKKVEKSKLLSELVKKNLKGGGKCPPPFEVD